jgi:3-oxoacyl-[acyl-carrier-protein] synthase II
MERVVVTGLAYVTSLGFNHDDHEPALREGRSGVGPITRFPTDGFRTRAAGQVDERALERRLLERHPAKGLRRLGVDTRMLLWAAGGALDDAKLRPSRPLPAIVGTTLEGFLQMETWYDEHLHGRNARPTRLLTATGGAQLAAVAGLLGVPLEPAIISNACATGITAIGRVFRRIRAGACEAGIAGGYDCVTRFVHLGFDSLGATTTTQCSPFDKARSGFFIGDGAAILVLESLASARRRGATIRAEIAGFGESADCHHHTQPDPEGKGVARAVRDAAAMAGVTAADVGYINAHGTATPANDAAESRGIVAALGEEATRIPISSTKPLVGHTLGAAGAVEQCFCILALERGFVPPQANLVAQDPACRVNVARSAEGKPQVAMNNAFGFGGANGVLVARRWRE